MKKTAEAFRDFLKQKNLQFTAQRQLIVDEFCRVKTHVSVEELYERVKKKEESVGQATVFRTLKLLAEAEIARPVNLGSKTIRFELDYGKEHHDHLVCTKCGAVIEVFDEALETLQDKLCKKYNFQPVSHLLEIFGICKNCM